MSNLRTSFVIDLTGNLQANARRYGQSLGKFAQDGRRHLNSLSRAADMYGRGLDRLGNRYTALLGGAGLGLAVNQVGNFNDRLLRLGIAADISDDKLKKLKKSIFDVAQDRDIAVDPGELLSALDAIVEKTGDLKFAKDNIRSIAVAMQATNTAGKDIGDIMAEFQKMGLIDPAQVMEAMDILNVQGKDGAFTLQKLASLGPRVITAYTAAGRTGVGAIRELGAVLQVIKQGTASPEMAATAFEAVMRTLTDPTKIAQIKKLTGIQIFDLDKLKEGKRVLRPINELMAEIVQKTNGDITKIGMIFDAEAIRAFNSMATEFSKSGSLSSLTKFMEVNADGTRTLNDAKRGAESYAATITVLRTSWQEFANKNLDEPIRDLSELLRSIEPEDIQRWLEIGKAVALVTGGLILVHKARKGLASVGSNGGGASGGGMGGGAPIPVYVVNGPGGGLGGTGGGASGGRGGSRLSRLAGGASRGLAYAEGAAVSFAGGYAIGTLLNEKVINPLASWVSGRDESLGTMIAGWIHDDEVKKALAPVPAKSEVGGKLSIQVEDNRLRVGRMEGKGGLDLEVETGRSMGAL